MPIQVSYPGVYIEEFTPAAPIEGVGTNTAAFIGVATRGDLDTPTKITSWDQFRATFGEHPVPGFFLWYAVRGFFENGGLVCYVVRASNATYSSIGLDDPANGLPNRAGIPMLTVRARHPGLATPALTVEIADAHLVNLANVLYRPVGTYSGIVGRDVTLSAGAGRFKGGDAIFLAGGTDKLPVLRATGNVLRLAADPPSGLPASGSVALALVDGTSTVRIQPPAPLPAGALVPGTVLTVTQVVGPQTVKLSQIVDSVQMEPIPGEPATLRLTFREPIQVSLALDPSVAASDTVVSEEFDFAVNQGAAKTSYNSLGVDAAHPRYFLPLINADGGPVIVAAIEPVPPTRLPDALPQATAAPVAFSSATNETLNTMAASDYIDALETLREIDDVNLVAISDAVTIRNPQNLLDEVGITIAQQALITHCEEMADRFAVLDARAGLGLFGPESIEEQRADMESHAGYAALYYPWLYVAPAAGPGGPVLVPPSGPVCGVIARSDGSRGVHKAPANEIVRGALGVERTMTDVDQGQLNLKGINIIRVFGGGRPVVWGARTTSTDTNWQYVNIRRLFLFLEESIQEGIRWAVFEPNDLGLWAKLRRTITEFLTRAWRDGALFGATAKDAFYVRIDEVLNPDSTRALGRLYIEIGVRPSYPAEFIVVRIGIWQGGSETTEV